MSKNVYRPRMSATLSVPYLGTSAERKKQAASTETLTIQLPLIEAHVEQNDFKTADSCRVVVDWRDTTLDTRMLDDGVLTVYMGEADDQNHWSPTADDVVFIGHVRNPERELTSEAAGTLSIEAVDYTGLFLEAKPFGSAGIPRYSDTLEGAWRRICAQTPGSAILADRLVCIGGIDKDELLSKAVAARFAKLSQVPTHPDTDAWAVWQQCVGMLGGIGYIDRDICVVTTATDLYTERDPPVFTWGHNLSTLSESRQNVDVKGGVCLVSFDPATGKTIEVFYPQHDDPRTQRKLTAAARKNKYPDSLTTERDKRHFFTMWGMTDPGQLLIVARRTWEQLSRQELSGKLTTPHMSVETVKGRPFPLTRLRAGDCIKVGFADNLKQYLSELPSETARTVHLLERNYSPDVARFLAKNVEAFKALGDTFYVDSVRIDMSVDDAGGDFEVEVSFMNKIEVSEGAVGPEGGESFVDQQARIDLEHERAQALFDMGAGPPPGTGQFR